MTKEKNGFTLIEFMIYSVIVVIIMVSLGLSAINIFQGRMKNIVISEVSRDARFVIEQIGKEIRQAESINFPLPNNESEYLSLEKDIYLDNPTIFNVESGVLKIKKGNDDAISLTSSKIEVTNLKFINTSYSTSTPGTIRTELTMKYLNPINKKEYDFQGTFYVTENIRK